MAKRQIRIIKDSKSGNESDYIGSHGGAGVGARLRRISERIDREASKVYAHAGVHFEQRWMGVVRLLDERGEMTVGELAQVLAITQPSVSQSLRSLQAAGFISEKADRRDGRRRIQRLTKAGIVFVGKIRPVWAALIEAMQELERQGVDMITPIDRLERLLDKKCLFSRALEYWAPRDVRDRHDSGK